MVGCSDCHQNDLYLLLKMFENSNCFIDDFLDVEIKEIKLPTNNKKTSASLEKRRKFPGPAGLLPENEKDVSLLHETTLQGTEDGEDDAEDTNQIHFTRSPWKLMSQEFGEYTMKYNINFIKTKLPSSSKMPFLGAIIVHIDYLKGKIPITMFTLKDATGEINSLIHHELYNEYEDEFTVGSVIILREFSVLSMSFGSNHCITVTRNNLLTIYSQTDNMLTQATQTNTQKSTLCKRIDLQKFGKCHINSSIAKATLLCNLKKPLEPTIVTKINQNTSVPTTSTSTASQNCAKRRNSINKDVCKKLYSRNNSKSLSKDVIGPSNNISNLPGMNDQNIFESDKNFDDFDEVVANLETKKPKLQLSSNDINTILEVHQRKRNEDFNVQLVSSNNIDQQKGRKTVEAKNMLRSFRFEARMEEKNVAATSYDKNLASTCVNDESPYDCDASQIFEDAISGLDTDSFFGDF